jgi:hypothetical protein
VRNGRQVVILGTLAAGVVAMGIANWALEKRNWNSGVSAALEWSRMLPVPASATNINLQTSGSMFSRSFVLEFDAPLADIEKWFAASPGTTGKSFDTVIQDKLGKVYDIKPGGGAQRANLTIIPSGHVRIDVSWS